MEILDIKRDVEKRELPMGTFEGKWSAYHVTFEACQHTYHLDVSVGVKGLNCPCRVTINQDRKVTIEPVTS